MNDWKTLRCDCGSELFVQAVKMVWKGGGGVTPSPVGMTCMECGKVLDTGKAAKLWLVEEARKKLAELEDLQH